MSLSRKCEPGLSEHFACQDSGLSQIFWLIVPTSEKIRNNINVARWSGDVIWRTGKKNFNAVSHNSARPCCFQTPCSISKLPAAFPSPKLNRSFRVYHISCYWMNIQVDSTSSNLASVMLNSKIRPRGVVGYGVKIFHPSPPNYVTRSSGAG